MTTRTEPWPQGTPSWIDLGTTDQAAATTFYSTLFGWNVIDTGPEMGNYGMATLQGLPAAGLMQLPAESDQPSAWTTYLAVDDVHKTAEAITSHGGTIAMPPMQVAEQGWFAIAQDPTGAFFGIWQAGVHTGAQVVNEPGALVWNECMTRDADRAREFYAAVFGYTYTAMEGAEYYTIDGEGPGGTIGGIGTLMANLPAEVPPHWMPYFMVADADATAAQVAALGGTAVNGPFDTPFGRMGVMSDPQGANFSIMSAPAE